MVSSLAAFLIMYVFAVDGKPIPTQFEVGVRMPPQQPFTPSRYHPAAPFTVSARHEPPEWSPIDRRYATNSIRTRLQAEAETAPAATPAAETKTASGPNPNAEGYVNIFEEPLETCVDDDYCTYRSATMAAHDICSGVRLAERVKTVGMAFKASPVNEDCYSILTYGASSSGNPWDFQSDLSSPERAQGFYFIPKCNALPAGLLDSQFSLDMMKGTVRSKEWQYGSKASDMRGEKEIEDTAPLGNLVETKATKQFRQAIDSICELCSAEAPSDKAKETLQAACAKLKAVKLAEQAKYDTSVVSVFLTSLVSTFLGAGATFALFRFGRSAWTVAEEPLLSA